MKLRAKLYVSTITMVVLPIVLCILSVGFIFQIQVESMAAMYGVDRKTVVENLTSSNVLMGMLTDRVFEELKLVSEESPNMFDDDTFLMIKGQELNMKLSTITVFKNNFLKYTSSEYSKTELQQLVRDYDFSSSDSDIGMYKGGKYQTLIKKLSFNDNNGNYYTVLVVTSMRQIIPELKEIVVQTSLAIILVIILTGMLLNLWIYGSIVRPVNKLKLATANIKHGNFDFEMPKISNDEIGDVCKDFEEMRIILKQTAEAKVKSDIEEKELIRNISHDLKTPITAIKGYVDGILDGVADTPEKQERYLRIIANKVNDMDNLINELTLFSRLDTNRVPYVFNNINLRMYFDDMCDEIGIDLDAAGIELNYQCHISDDVYIAADAEQLKRVINNIVSNSVKYMEPERLGQIWVDVYDEGEYAHIIMRDNGKGIGSAELPHIFERFYRTDSSRNSRQGGSGIGLAIVKKIIEDHKGKIWAESVEGEGTTMHICLKTVNKDMEDNKV